MDRRSFLKSGMYSTAAALSAPALLNIASGQAEASSTSFARDFKAAGYPTEHVKGLMTGKVQIRGNNIKFDPSAIGDLNTHAILGPRTYDFTEIGLMPYIIAFANDDFRAYSLIPVFPLRIFRHKSIFVRSDSGISKPADLKGRRVGTTGYSSSSLTAIRGLLSDEYGIRPKDIKWVIARQDSSAKDSGKASKQENVYPDNLDVSFGPEGKDESDLLLDGDVDALFHAAEPRAYREGNPNIKRLFEDPRQVEQAYYKKTGIFPIMHAVAVRSELITQYPWMPKAIFGAYIEAKNMAYADMQQKWYLRTMPWFAQELEATQELMGTNFYQYGIEPNRKALDTVFRYAHEQGFANRQIKIEEVFSGTTLDFLDD